MGNVLDNSGQDVGLGSRGLLDKVDKARALGVADHIALPQIVVVGDQSSGKSSTLESVTGIPFPRAVQLCTRYATEIICRREDHKSIVVSIQPATGSSLKHEQECLAFRRELSDFTGHETGKVFKEAAVVMGIKVDLDTDTHLPAFSLDVLRVEKNGPDEEHLTVIDVPGIFENITPGITIEADIGLVKTMVKNYIKDSRTIILAVTPSNVDIATQQVIRLAKEADPEGRRTIGVLTKPDTAVETSTKQAVIDLVQGRRNALALGYYVVKNRSADDHSSTAVKRNIEENLFFGTDPWTQLPRARCGISSLRSKLRDLLMERTRAEMPKVRREIAELLKRARAEEKAMGDARGTPDQQRLYLGARAESFRRLKELALDAYYTGDPIFSERSELKLVTRIREMNEAFARLFYEKAHTREFEEVELDGEDVDEKDDGAKKEPSLSNYKIASSDRARDGLYPLRFHIPVDEEDELGDILADSFVCPDPEAYGIMEEIKELNYSSRGYELGIFNSTMIPTTFREQAQKWTDLTLAHVSNAILVVHHFIREILDASCPERDVKDELWAFLQDELVACYNGAMAHARFLLDVELNGRAVTLNPQFDVGCEETQTARAANKLKSISDKAALSGSSLSWWKAQKVARAPPELQIHDIVKSYYEVVRSRFVENVCTQAVDHFLISGERSPLAVFHPSRVNAMTPEQLESVAGEDQLRKSRREELQKMIAMLEEGLKTLKA